MVNEDSECKVCKPPPGVFSANANAGGIMFSGDGMWNKLVQNYQVENAGIDAVVEWLTACVTRERGSVSFDSLKVNNEGNQHVDAIIDALAVAGFSWSTGSEGEA